MHNDLGGVVLEGLGWLVGFIAAATAVVLVGYGAIVIDGRLARRGAHTASERTALGREHRTALLSMASLVIATAVAVVTMLGRGSAWPMGPVLVPGHIQATLPLIGVALLMVIETWRAHRWPRTQGARREASIHDRTVADLLPTGRRWLWAWFALLAFTCLALGLSPSGPRAISRVINEHGAYTITPYPGWLWVLPVMGAAGLVALALDVALRATAARPRAIAVTADWDMWLRRRTARRLVRVTCLVLGLTTGALLAFAANGLWLVGRGHGNNAQFPGAVSTFYIGGAQALIVLAAIIALLAVVQYVTPIRDSPPESQPTPALAPAGLSS